MALLCIVDDGSEEGEWLRLRGDQFVIGRSDGHLIIPHDTMMSSRHAELVRKHEGGKYRWYLNDLHSTNGAFVRIGKAALQHDQELLIGTTRFRFEAAALADAIAKETGAPCEPFLLSRVKATQSQVGLSRAQRADNVQGAFQVSAEARGRVKGRRIVLVDDVLTSGATANAAARALLRGGAAQVDLLVFARVVTSE